MRFPATQLLVRFRRDRHAVVAVEFAMIGLAVMFFIVASLQIGAYYYCSASLEYATARAMRQVMTGAAGAGSMTADTFRTTVLCPLLPNAMSCSNVVLNLQTVAEGTNPGGFYQFINANQSWILPPTQMNNAQTSFCTGSSGSVIYAQVYYAMPIVFSGLFTLVSTNWNGQSVYFIGSYAAFRNEPFQGTSGTC